MYQDNNSTNPFLTQSSRRVLTTQWTRLEDKLFEQALVMFPEGISDRWQKIAERVPGKSSREVKEHYDMLLYDVYEIDAGRVEIPNYADDLLSCWNSNDEISFVSKSKQGENERKKSTPWTEEEHKLFLIGLKKFGKGDWRSISRNVVVTRTPTQVASHAQKYFLRQNSVKKERKRSSIHDITTVDGSTMDAPVDQNWVSLPGGSVQQERLLEQMRSIDWGTLILQAYLNSVNLSANSDHVPNFSSMLYLNYGVAVSEVEVNLLTGETETLKTDYILCATAKLKSCCGFSQIEGAFVQGIGSLCLKNTPQSQMD